MASVSTACAVPEHQGTVTRLVRLSTRAGVVQHHLNRQSAVTSGLRSAATAGRSGPHLNARRSAGVLASGRWLKDRLSAHEAAVLRLMRRPKPDSSPGAMIHAAAPQRSHRDPEFARQVATGVGGRCHAGHGGGIPLRMPRRAHDQRDHKPD